LKFKAEFRQSVPGGAGAVVGLDRDFANRRACEYEHQNRRDIVGPLGTPEVEDRESMAIPAAVAAAAKASYRLRREREKLFGAGLFADPIWDMLLDLLIAAAEGRRVCVSSACIASSVPVSTALRHIAHMEKLGLVMRMPNPKDSRSSYVELTDDAVAKLIRHLSPAPPAAGTPPS
jgi:hypothetical protein